MKTKITLAMIIIGFVLCSTVAAYMPMLIIRECPHCKSQVVQKETVSGNTIGATYWTDGKREAKMLPDHPWLSKCPACSRLFWVDEAVEVDTGFDAAKGKQQVLAPSEKELLNFLERPSLYEDKEVYSNELDMLVAAIGAGHPQAVIDLFWRSFPNLLLSPLAHLMLSQAFLDLKRENEAEGEKAMGRLILKSILAAGKGTKKRPYAVMRVEDERDVLSVLKKQAGAQFLMMNDSRMLDLLQCSDGSEVYFDITLMYGRGIKKEPSAVAE